MSYIIVKAKEGYVKVKEGTKIYDSVVNFLSDSKCKCIPYRSANIADIVFTKKSKILYHISGFAITRNKNLRKAINRIPSVSHYLKGKRCKRLPKAIERL